MRRKGFRYSNLALSCYGKYQKKITCEACGHVMHLDPRYFIDGFIDPINLVCSANRCNQTLCEEYRNKKACQIQLLKYETGWLAMYKRDFLYLTSDEH